MQPGGGTPPLPVLQQLWPSLFPGGRWNGGSLVLRRVGFLLAGAKSGGAVLAGSVLCQAGKIPLLAPEPPPMATPSLSLSSLSTEFPGCVHSAFSATLGVCSYVILFSVLTALADCSGLLPACIQAVAGLIPGENVPVLCRSACMGFAGNFHGNGCLTRAVDAPGALPLAAFLLGWGGLSVHCQSLPFWRAAGVRPGPYLRAKISPGDARCRDHDADKCLPAPFRPCHGTACGSHLPRFVSSRDVCTVCLSRAPFCASPKKEWKRQGKTAIIDANVKETGGTSMLFKRNIDPSCTYCRRGKQITEETILCQRKGVVSPAGSCTAFRYDPLKRVPPRPATPDFSQLKEEDFLL